MKHLFYRLRLKHIVSLLVLAASYQSFAQVKNTAINYPNFFSKLDPIFNTLSTKWEEGAFIGNGLLGAMIYREDDNAIRFDLGRTDVADHRLGMNPSVGRPRLPIGRFVLRPAGKIKSINLRMDLWNAEVNGVITTDKGKIELQALTAATKDIFVFNTKTSVEEKNFKWEWIPEISQTPFRVLGRDTSSSYKPNPQPTLTEDNGINYNYQPLLVGGSYTTAWKKSNQFNQQLLLITISNSFPADDSKKQAEQALSGISVQNISEVLRAHRNKWHQFYQQSFISIPDSRLESFWWIQQYKMASATRVGAYPIDLMGPWYRVSPWPKYWWNLNIQLTYYPFFASNHLDLAKPLMRMINDNLDNLIKNSPEQYQYNSAALARSGPYDMSSPLKVVKGNDSTGNSASSLELGNLPWLLHVYWQAYEYSMDKEVIKNLYPVLTRSINYYLNIMEKDAGGKYHLPYTYSPEYPKGITRDANYDLSLFKWGCGALLKINEVLQLNDPVASKWKDVLANLTPYPADELGFRIGKDASFNISHRHYSHLLQVYPIYDVNWDQPENRDLIKRSLNQWEKNGSAWRGYSYTGSGSIYAMMGNGNKTHFLLNEMMKGRFSIKPNTMYTEAGPVIETPLSAVTTMNEMLLQSWNGVVRIFPAVPDSWKEASFDKLRAKGAFLVSAVRKGGKTQFVKIKSLAGEPLLVKSDLGSTAKIKGGRKFTITNKGNGVIGVGLKKGEEVVIYENSYKGDFSVQPVAVTDGKPNYWGLQQ